MSAVPRPSLQQSLASRVRQYVRGPRKPAGSSLFRTRIRALGASPEQVST
ncbi:MAG: hypothetical protein VX899_01870 [Myxococcota bacterium]|nr:hypothetical protein [Myxococcota bacterium]